MQRVLVLSIKLMASFTDESDFRHHLRRSHDIQILQLHYHIFLQNHLLPSLEQSWSIQEMTLP